MDEAAWADIAPFEMTMYTPTFQGPLSERTEIGSATTTATCTSPGACTTRNPNDGEFTGGPPMNADWNSYWDVATSRSDEGWFAEFRIPFSTLGFQVTDGEVTMGLIAYRLVARMNERQTFPAIDPSWGRFGFAKPSQAQRVVLRDVRQSPPLYVTPYSLGGFRQTPVLAEPPEAPRAEWRSERDPTAEAGLDIKYSPTSNLALDPRNAHRPSTSIPGDSSTGCSTAAGSDSTAGSSCGSTGARGRWAGWTGRTSAS